MKELLENTESREIEILQFLYNEDMWYTVQTIATALDYSVDTIYRSINHINEVAIHYNIELSITSQKTKGMYLSTNSYSEIMLYQAVTIKNSLAYKLLDRIFQSAEPTIDRLANDFYVSKSTIYRKLRAIEVFFSKRGLTFNTSTFDITGSEIILRKFFFQMYWSAVATNHWPFKDISKQVLEHRISEANSHLTETQTLQILYLLAVNFVRHKKKFYITKFDEAAYIDPYRANYFSFVRNFYEDNIPKQYLSNEHNFLLLVFLIQGNNQEQEVNISYVNNWYKEQSSLPYLMVTSVLSQMIEAYPEETGLADESLLLLLITNSIEAFVFERLKYSDFFDSVDTTVLLARTPIFSKTLVGILNDSYRHFSHSNRPFNYRYMLYKTYLIMANFINLRVIEEKLRIKLVCTADPLREHLFKSQLNNISDYNLLISHFSDECDLGPQNADLIITDFLSPTTSDAILPQIYLSTFPPTKRDWNNIIKLLDELKKKREAPLQ